MVKDKVVEAEWKHLDVNEHRQQMKNIPPLSFYRLDALPAAQPTASKH